MPQVKSKSKVNDEVFDMVEAVADKSRVDILREGKRAESSEGEVSSWFPSGKFLGMKVPKGTKNIISSLTFDLDFTCGI